MTKDELQMQHNKLKEDYEANYQMLLKTVGKPIHEEYVRVERGFHKLDIKLRKALVIYAPEQPNYVLPKKKRRNIFLSEGLKDKEFKCDFDMSVREKAISDKAYNKFMVRNGLTTKLY